MKTSQSSVILFRYGHSIILNILLIILFNISRFNNSHESPSAIQYPRKTIKIMVFERFSVNH